MTEFIDQAHRAVGEPAGSYFCIVLFGGATAYPHGVKDPQILKDGDMVLIDTGCELEGYHSDITRCYVFGQPNGRQREVWDHEHAAQAAAFAAAWSTVWKLFVRRLPAPARAAASALA